ncbi:MAG: hypothetical protein ABFS38_04835 [Bacteroidota bacterium]
MSDHSNKLSQLWWELKRRKVIKVITMYAATAFIIMEAGDIMLPRLGLPEWTVTFIIVLLIVGFPITIILSWIFDITPQGVKKTEPVQHEKKKETTPDPVKRGLRISNGIIALLVVVVCILLYPKIFKKDKFEGIRDPDGKISISVMPFENLSGDTLYNVWQEGFQNLLITTLSNSEELSVRQYQAMYAVLKSERNLTYASITPSVASEVALKLETKTYILGNILKAGNKIRVNAQLVDTKTEEIYKTYEVDLNSEDDIFAMADSLSGLIRNYLEIKKIIEEYDSPVFSGSLNTNSSEAFEHYIHGYNAFANSDRQTATEWLLKSIEADSGFISAYVILSYNYRLMGYDKLAKRWCNIAYMKRDELPLKEKLMLEHLNAYYHETPNEQIKYLKQILDIDEMNPIYWFLLGKVYFNLYQYSDAILPWEKALEIHKNWGTNYRNRWIYYWLGESYHNVNDHKREKEVYELGLSVFPDHPTIISYQATCALSQGDTDKADQLITKYRSIRENSSMWSESSILSGVGYIYSRAELFDEAERSFRQSLELDPRNPSRINDLAWFLIDNDIGVDEGVDLIQKALELSPEDWYFLDTKGWGLYKQGRVEEALQVLTGSWDLRPAYNHDGYQHIQEVKKALASQNN